MAADLQTLDTASASRKKRKTKYNKGKNPSKRVKQQASPMAAAKPRKPSKKMRKLFRKRVREYHSDDEEEVNEERQEEPSSDDEEEGEKDLDVADDGSEGSEGDDEEDGEGAQRGITRFVDGCRAFRVAFAKIMKKHLPDDPLGPILSSHKKLVAEKLAEEDAEHKMKGETKKEKQLAAEKGHIKPANFLDSKEKFLINVATKGVVKLFNAVSKAQSSQSGLNPSSSKDAKVLAKRRKQTFFSELQKPTTQVPDSKIKEKSNEPGWALLRDSYMLTNSKLKDWDKMPEPAAVAGEEHVSSENSDDEE